MAIRYEGVDNGGVQGDIGRRCIVIGVGRGVRCEVCWRVWAVRGGDGDGEVERRRGRESCDVSAAGQAASSGYGYGPRSSPVKAKQGFGGAARLVRARREEPGGGEQSEVARGGRGSPVAGQGGQRLAVPSFAQSPSLTTHGAVQCSAAQRNASTKVAAADTKVHGAGPSNIQQAGHLEWITSVPTRHKPVQHE